MFGVILHGGLVYLGLSRFRPFFKVI